MPYHRKPGNQYSLPSSVVLFDAARAEAALAALGVGEFFFGPGDGFVTGDDELGDAVSGLDDEGRAAEVQENDFDLAAIGGVDGARGIGDGDGVLIGEAGAWADLSFVAGGEFDGEACCDGVGLSREDGDVLDAAEVHTGVFFGAVGVDGEFCVRMDSLDFDSHGTLQS